jgi:hypothetical protein
MKAALGQATVGQGPPIKALFQKIESTAGIGRDSGRMTSGDLVITHGGDKTSGRLSMRNSTDLEASFWSDKLSGRLHARGGSVRVTLEETQAPQRTLEFSQDGRGELRLQLTHPDGDQVLLHQARHGKFLAVAVVGGQTFTGQAESFLALLRQHRREMEAHILPVLEHGGICLVPSPHMPSIRKGVLGILLRTAETQAEGNKLLTDLDHDSFAVREKASEVLNVRFELYQDMIQEKLREKPISPKVRTRLQRILAQHTEAQRVYQAVAALNLLQDAGYVVSLLHHVTAKETPRLIGHLEKITGQRLGAEPAAWKEWAKKNLK